MSRFLRIFLPTLIYNNWESENSHKLFDNDENDVTDSNFDGKDREVDLTDTTVSDCEGTDDEQYLIEPFSPLNVEKAIFDAHSNNNNNKNSSSNSPDNQSDSDQTDPNILMIKKLKSLRRDFEAFCEQIPVLGFNSAKYDLNLIKERLAKH